MDILMKLKKDCNNLKLLDMADDDVGRAFRRGIEAVERHIDLYADAYFNGLEKNWPGEVESGKV